MAYGIPGPRKDGHQREIECTINETLTEPYLPVQVYGDNNSVRLPPNATSVVHGIAQGFGGYGLPVSVVMWGETLVAISESINFGKLIIYNGATGNKVSPKGNVTSDTYRILGRALATVSGGNASKYVNMFFNPQNDTEY